MQTGERMFILQCLRDLCAGRDTKRPDGPVDMEAVFRYAKEQSLGGIICHQCRSWILTETYGKKFLNLLKQDAYYSVNREILVQEVITELEKKKIAFICMKGSVVRDRYPIPELRTMGDIDMVFHSEDREIAGAVMQELGYRKFVDNHAVWSYLLKDYEFELHDHMFYEQLTNEIDYISYFDQVWDHIVPGSVFGRQSSCLYVPEESYHLLYLITHLAKHVINKGAGLRSFLDLVMITQNNPKLDWIYLEKELAELKLLEFARTCFALCEGWFDVTMPLSHEPLDEEFYEEITEKAFRDGTFGLKNSQNIAVSSAKQITRENRSYLVSVIKWILQKLFPPYRDMQLIPWYSFVDGRPWLMPFAWVYRWIYCIVHKFRHGYRKLLEPILNRKKIEARRRYIRDWGL